MVAAEVFDLMERARSVGVDEWWVLDDARNDPDLISRAVEVASSFAWTRGGAVTQAGSYDWL